jgi:localization factor PodJL
VVNPELPANAPEASGGQNEIAPGTTQESNVLDGHLPAQGGTAPDIAEPSGEPGAAEPANSAPESGSVEPAKETTSSLSTDPRAEPRPQPQPENVNTAQMPPLPEAVGPAALRQAASDGDPVAQFEVASRLAEGRGIDPDAATAAKWYQLAAASGLAPAQYRLGSLYEKGTGVAKDRSSARIWYERAAEQGNRKAMHNLAVLHADGINGQPDFANAARWFRAAAELGLNDSQYNLGILHVRGLGVPQNLAEAYKWFAILASHGDKDAAARRDAVAGQMDASAVAAARLAAKTWKAKPLIAQANAVRLPDAGWASPEPASNPALPGPEIIRTAQKLLSLGGYQPGPADGRWGPMTQTAIRTFQRDAGLEATGELTPDLLQKMHSRLAG